jgi:hypothetical protein
MKRMAKACLKTVTLAILVASIVLPVLVRAVDYNAGVKAGEHRRKWHAWNILADAR